MPHNGHQHHHAHRNADGPAEVTPPRVGVKILLLGMFGFCFLIMGIVFTTSVWSSLTITGIVFLVVGAFLAVLSVALCCRVRRLYQQQLADDDFLHAGGGTTVVYGQPGATSGQRGMQPTIQPQTHEPANVMLRPGGRVMFPSDAQTNLLPNVSRSPGAGSQYPETDPEAPPPAYEDVVNQDTDPGNIGVD